MTQNATSTMSSNRPTPRRIVCLSALPGWSSVDSAAARIEATDWKLARAREREAAGWATLAEVDAVLAEREAIRRSSNAAEAAVDAALNTDNVRTGDLGGKASTKDFTAAIIKRLA